MKAKLILISKLMIMIIIIIKLPFIPGILHMIEANKMVENMVYNHVGKESKSDFIKLLGSYHQVDDIALSIETTRENPMVIPQINHSKQKRIYIYNTHQDEQYNDGKTVMDGALYLAKKLEAKGYQVVVETNDFSAYRKSKQMSYDQSYEVSLKFLNDALVNYQGFDLCIDLHRDSIDRNLSYVKIDGVGYAKMMIVVAGSSKYADYVLAQSNRLYEIIESKQKGIMRSVFNRKVAFYNQFVQKDMLLIECGSHENSYQEICHSLNYLADGIDELLRDQV